MVAIRRRKNMATSEQLGSLFSTEESEQNYEEEKRIKKQRLVRNEFIKCGKYGIPLIKSLTT